MKGQLAEERFWDRVHAEPNSGCWLWVGFVTRKGYGTFSEGKNYRAHRWAYEHYAGDIPEGMDLDHTCKTPECVNPDHLQVCTHHFSCGQARREATHCRQGHLLSGENLRIQAYGNRAGRRRCRTCARLYMRERRKGGANARIAL
jgi:hypothetical protein